MALSKKKKSPIEVKLVIRENSNKDTTFNKVFICIYERLTGCTCILRDTRDRDESFIKG